jgi:hypothetical protein
MPLALAAPVGSADLERRQEGEFALLHFCSTITSFTCS